MKIIEKEVNCVGNTKSIKLEFIDIEKEEINNYIFSLISDPYNLRKIFDNKVFYKENKIKNGYFEWFIPFELLTINTEDNFTERLNEYFNDEKISIKKEYFAIAELLTPIIVKDKLGIELMKHIFSLSDPITQRSTGADQCFFSEKDKKLFIGESKFFERFNDALRSVEGSIKNFSGRIKELYQTSKDSGKLSILMINAQKDFSQENLQYRDFLSEGIKKGLIVFILHEKGDYTEGTQALLTEINNALLDCFDINFDDNYIFRLKIDSKIELIKLIILNAARIYYEW